MENNNRAKEIFIKNKGYWFFILDSDFNDEYRSYKISKEQENEWRREKIAEIKKEIQNERNRHELVSLLADYNFFQYDRKDYFIVDYLEEHFDEFDFLTNLRICEEIMKERGFRNLAAKKLLGKE